MQAFCFRSCQNAPASILIIPTPAHSLLMPWLACCSGSLVDAEINCLARWRCLKKMWPHRPMYQVLVNSCASRVHAEDLKQDPVLHQRLLVKGVGGIRCSVTWLLNACVGLESFFLSLECQVPSSAAFPLQTLHGKSFQVFTQSTRTGARTGNPIETKVP